MLQGRPGSILGAILGAKWEAKGTKMAPKIDLKIDEIWSAFFDAVSRLCDSAPAALVMRAYPVMQQFLKPSRQLAAVS